MSLFPAYLARGHDHTQVEEYTPAAPSDDSFPGEFVVVTAGVATRCGTNPAVIAGLSEIRTEAGKVLTPNGKVPIRVLHGAGAVVALSCDTTLVAATHIGNSYGITRHSGTGFWQLDISKTTTTSRVRVIAIHEATNTAFCVVHENALQFADVTVAQA